MTSFLVRGVGFAVLAVTAILVAGPIGGIIASVSFVAVRTATSLQRSPLPRTAALLSPAGASEANGFVNAASGFGGFAGCLGAGLLAQAVSYEAVLWLGAGTSVIALLFLPPVVAAVRRVRVAG